MTACDQPGHDWTVVLRRWRARIVEGQPQGGAADAFEVICCYCGDHPDLDYRAVSPELRQIRGPYPIAAGIAAFEEHLGLHPPAVHEPPGRHTGVNPDPHLNRNVRAAKASPESRTVVWGNA
jgi:hypothetical protein